MKIYISGPITGHKDYMSRFERMEKTLSDKGYTVINPAKVNAQLPAGTTHEEYMKTSLVMLGMCKAILMMKGWQDSKGCGIEFEHAYENGMMILFEERINELQDWKKYVCEHLCVHAAEDSEYLEQRCKECRIKK